MRCPVILTPVTSRPNHEHSHPQYSPKAHGHVDILSRLRELADRFIDHLRDHASGTGQTSTAAIAVVPDIAPSDQTTVAVRLPAVMPDGYVACAQLVGATAALAGGRIVGWQTTNARRVDVLIRNAGASILTGVSVLVVATVAQPVDAP